MTLTVTHNNLGELDQRASKLFQNFQALTVLNLSDNKITSVTDFSAIPALDYLDLSNNLISVYLLLSLYVKVLISFI